MDDRLETLTLAMTALDEQTVLALVKEALADSTSALAVVQACERGMRGVGERYEQEEVFLTGLIMAGEIFRQVLTLTQSDLEQELAGSASGKVLLGTVAGDIHNIGKNLVGTALRSFGFTVTDLGVDVSPKRFVEEARAFQPDVVGLSGLITASYQSMRETIGLLREHAADLGRRVPVVIGGGTIDERVREFVGADYWTVDALEGVRICQRITSAG
ncbi:MAG: cobalamin-dependent protein [Thermoleophilia bacterium]|nr:cobalamin-dependent protein [Thermoleophilia bacterium]